MLAGHLEVLFGSARHLVGADAATLRQLIASAQLGLPRQEVFLLEIEKTEIEGVVEAAGLTQPDGVVAETLPVDVPGPVGHQPGFSAIRGPSC